jgi:hypothetical protein
VTTTLTPAEVLDAGRGQRIIHMCLSVRGALSWGKREQRRALTWMLRSDGTPYASVEELRSALFDELAAGREVLPMGDCDNFDFKRGCLGHTMESAARLREAK